MVVVVSIGVMEVVVVVVPLDVSHREAGTKEGFHVSDGKSQTLFMCPSEAVQLYVTTVPADFVVPSQLEFEPATAEGGSDAHATQKRTLHYHQ